MFINKKEVNGAMLIEIGKESKKLDDGSVKADGYVELDVNNKEEIEQTIDDMVKEKKSKVVVDMKNVTYLDSSSLWALFEGHKKITRQGGEFRLANLNPDVKRIFDLTKLSKRIKIFNTLEEALQSSSP